MVILGIPTSRILMSLFPYPCLIPSFFLLDSSSFSPLNFRLAGVNIMGVKVHVILMFQLGLFSLNIHHWLTDIQTDRQIDKKIDRFTPFPTCAWAVCPPLQFLSSIFLLAILSSAAYSVSLIVEHKGKKMDLKENKTLFWTCRSEDKRT